MYETPGFTWPLEYFHNAKIIKKRIIPDEKPPINGPISLSKVKFAITAPAAKNTRKKDPKNSSVKFENLKYLQFFIC